MKKIIRIIKSRINKTTINQEVTERIDTCLCCKYNSLNTKGTSFIKLFLIKLSDFYSFLMGKGKEDIYGNCTACEGCSVFYKALELEDEKCPEGYWSIYKPNSSKTKNGNKSKNRGNN